MIYNSSMSLEDYSAAYWGQAVERRLYLYRIQPGPPAELPVCLPQVLFGEAVGRTSTAKSDGCRPLWLSFTSERHKKSIHAQRKTRDCPATSIKMYYHQCAQALNSARSLVERRNAVSLA
jgi:hypothetical protein